MKPIRLEDLRPEPAEFYLRKTDKTYRLRMVSLDDDRWMIKTFGDRLKAIFEEGRTEEICRIVYRLLEDKSDFIAREVVDFDENGDEVRTRKGGVEILFSMITGVSEKIVLHRALMAAIGVSAPLLDEIIQDAEEAEKKSQPVPSEPSAGEPSSISSPPSTDGPGPISGP